MWERCVVWEEGTCIISVRVIRLKILHLLLTNSAQEEEWNVCSGSGSAIGSTDVGKCHVSTRVIFTPRIEPTVLIVNVILMTTERNQWVGFLFLAPFSAAMQTLCCPDNQLAGGCVPALSAAGRERGDCGQLCSTAQCSACTGLQSSKSIPAGDVSAVRAQPPHPYTALRPRPAWLCALYSVLPSVRLFVLNGSKGVAVRPTQCFWECSTYCRFAFLLNTVMLCRCSAQFKTKYIGEKKTNVAAVIHSWCSNSPSKERSLLSRKVW